MSRTLRPEDRIAHYKVVSAIAAGGMGEVYLAQDQKLERSVALKILPPDLVKNEERVRRFEREAKSASSLSHPNIVTIYEIGEGPLEAEGDEPSSESIHFISMELVTGETLRDRIHVEKADLRSLLGWLAQAAEGIAKAHAAGIVHRDLKPSNIMVTRDGYAKVLDFGLAKLTERQQPGEDMTAAATALPDATEDGVVLGTAGYMSPEQVRGKAVDARSDIFSFGCILYEAVTRQRPFSGDSNVETMHRILHDAPEPVENLNPDAPREVRRLIRRCLARNPDQRLQSMKDLALELREIVDEYETLSPSGTSAATAVDSGSGSGLHAQVGGRRVPPLALAGIVVLGLAGLVLGVASLFRGAGGETAPAAGLAFTPIVQGSALSPDMRLSPDGAYLAYTRSENGQEGIYVRQIATGSDVATVPPAQEDLRGLSFSLDGNYLYFLQRDPDARNYSAAFEVPFLGGSPRKRWFDVDSPVTFSPDGTRVAFHRGLPDQGMDALVIVDLGTGEERVFTGPQGNFRRPAWSPDGKSIACGQFLGVNEVRIVRVDPATGKAVPIGEPWLFLTDFTWAGPEHLVVGGLLPESLEAQLYRVDAGNGEVHRLSRDSDTYELVSASADGSSLVAYRRGQASDLWVLDLDGASEPRRLTQGTARSGSVSGFTLTDKDEIVAGIETGASLRLHAFPLSGGTPRPILPDAMIGFEPEWIPGTSSVLFNSYRPESGLHVWRVDVDGGNLRQLTHGELGEEQDGRLLDDDRTFLYTTIEPVPRLFRMSVDGGEPTQVYKQDAGFSPDGTLLLSSELRAGPGGRTRTTLVVTRVADGEEVLTHVPDFLFDPLWAADGSALTAVRGGRRSQGLEWVPLDGSPPHSLVDLPPGLRLTDHTWFPGGEGILLFVDGGEARNLYAVDADGSNFRQVTDFPTGVVFGIEWSPDGKRLLFTHGQVEEDIVLARDVR